MWWSHAVTWWSQLLPSSTDATVSYDSDAETVTLEFPSELPVGDIVLSFQYTGVLNDQMRGFYSSKYTHPDHPGEDRYVAVTQFEVEYNSQDCQLYCNALWGEPEWASAWNYVSPDVQLVLFLSCSKNCPFFSLQLRFFDLFSIDQSQLCRQCGHDIIMQVLCHCIHANQHGGVQNTVLRETSREKTFVNFVVLCLFAKVFPAKFGGVAPFGTTKASNSRTFSPRKSYFPPIRNSFPLKCFPLYSRSLTWFNTLWD